MALPLTQAQATEDCVSGNEYKRIKKGMTRARVAQIFDTDGKSDGSATIPGPSGFYTVYYRTYEGCSWWDANVTYRKKKGTLRVIAKSKEGVCVNCE